jgi:hypothetical protein
MFHHANGTLQHGFAIAGLLIIAACGSESGETSEGRREESPAVVLRP